MLNVWPAAMTEAFYSRLKQFVSSLLRARHQRTSRDASWLLVGAVASRIATSVSFMPVARAIGSTGFGKLQIVVTSTTVAAVVAQAGMAVTATKHIAEWNNRAPERIRRLIAFGYFAASAFGLVMTIAGLMAARPLATNWYRDPSLSFPLALSCASLLFNSLSGLQTGILSGLGCFREASMAMMVGSLVGAPILGICAYAYGLNGAVTGLNLQAVITWAVGEVYVIRALRRFGLPPMWNECLREARVFFSFSMPSVLSGLLVSPANWLAASFLIACPSGYSQMAIYGAAGQWRRAVLFVPTSVGSLLIARLSALYGAGDESGYRRMFRQSLFAIFGAGTLACLGLVVAAPILLRGYGADFGGGFRVFLWIGISAVVVSINNMYSRAHATLGKMWFSLSSDAIWSLAFAIFSYRLVAHSGALGLAYAANLAALIQLAYQYLSWRWLARGTIVSAAPTLSSASPAADA